MYTTCLWCTQPLGRNQVVERFPVGRRLAFDAAKGRLWVVCRACERWNLTPLEERWEAIEACERLYRETRERASTGEIGLARLRDGTDLVRIGRPLLPELAAWRYRPLVRRRLAGAAVRGTVYMLSIVAASLGANAVGVGALAVAYVIGSLRHRIHRRTGNTIVHDARGEPMLVRRDALYFVRADVSEGILRLRLPLPEPGDPGGERRDVLVRAPRASGRGRGHRVFFDAHDGLCTWLEGETAARALARLMPVLNRDGAMPSSFADGVALAERVGPGTPGIIALLKGRLTQSESPLETRSARRLALEIRLHEADERRWLEGELAELEARWREAEELAAIADRLTVPAEVEARLAAGPRAGS